MLHNLHLLRPLWLIALLPLAWIVWKIYRNSSESNAWRDLVDPHLLPHLLVGEKNRQAYLPTWMLGLGGVLGILALAGPVWERLPQPIYQTQNLLIIALDLSPTMDATDASPSRLAQARFKILDLLKRTREGQTAMLAYGTEPFLVSPLTTDAATIAAQVPDLNTDILPVSGASRADLALNEAESLLKQVDETTGEVLLITDALEYPAATQEVARRLRTHGYTVSVLGVGTEQGAPVPLKNGGFLKDTNGAILLPRLQQDNLKTLAAVGGGQYATASIDDGDLNVLFPKDKQHNIKPSASSNTTTDQWREEGPLLLLALLPLAALGFRRGWVGPLLLCLYLAPSDPAQAFSWQNLWLNPDQQAASQLAAGRAKEAAKIFQHPDWRAAAQYQAGNYSQVLDSLKQSKDPQADYNRGNALAKLGRLKEALTAYKKAIDANFHNQDAKINFELVKKLLEQQKNQQQQSEEAKSQQQQQNSQSQTSNKPNTSKPESASASDQKADQSPKKSGEKQQPGKEQHGGDNKDMKDMQDMQDMKDMTEAQQASAQHAQDDKKSQELAKNLSKNQSNNQSKDRNDSGYNSAQQRQKADFSQSDAAIKPDNENIKNNEQKNKDFGSNGILNNALTDQNKPAAAVETLAQQKARETNQAMTAKLNLVPDDPAGLLRQRFILQHLRRLQEAQ